MLDRMKLEHHMDISELKEILRKLLSGKIKFESAGKLVN
jgi:hypothetical protein